MPRLEAGFLLSSPLSLQDGDYPTAPEGKPIRLSRLSLEGGRGYRTRITAEYDHPESPSRGAKTRYRTNDAKNLLQCANRLLRWYRATSRQSDVTEVTRAQASPFEFRVLGDSEPAGWNEPLIFEADGPVAIASSLDAQSEAVRLGLATGDDPDVADLFLLDAERALREGRFREAVLFCWSTIDAKFNRKYEALVDAALTGEWSEARAVLKGRNIGLRTKMSAVMHLIANRSLFREPDQLWKNLTDSYTRRNDIIHKGKNATEDEARSSLEVAHRVVDIMNSL